MAERKKIVAERQRVVAVGKKVVAEHRRVVAEGKKIVAEHRRVVAEGRKVVAEHRRVVAEGKKVVAEHRRVVAEDGTPPKGEGVTTKAPPRSAVRRAGFSRRLAGELSAGLSTPRAGGRRRQ